jgi:hypothetical protein
MSCAFSKDLSSQPAAVSDFRATASAPASKPAKAKVLERLSVGRNCGRKTMDEVARWMEEVGEHLASSHGQSSAGRDLHYV